MPFNHLAKSLGSVFLVILCLIINACGEKDTGAPNPLVILPATQLNLRFQNINSDGDGMGLNVLMGDYIDEGNDDYRAEVIIYQDTTEGSNGIAEPLLLIPGATGVRVEDQFSIGSFYGHRTVIMLGFRGISDDSSIYDCTGDSTNFSSCLPSHGELSQFNPKQTALDTINLMQLLVQDKRIIVDSKVSNASTQFGDTVDFSRINIFTASYGGTVVTYLAEELDNLANSDSGAGVPFEINRLVVDNGDGPNQKVISQGFAINLNRTERLLDACAANNFCNTNYAANLNNLSDWMELHHENPISLSIVDASGMSRIDEVNIYSSTLFAIWDEAWETANIQSNNITGRLIELLSAVAADPNAGEVTLDASEWTNAQLDSLVNEINFAANTGGFTLENREYSNNFIDLNSLLPLLDNDTKKTFISRTGLICSAYITRSNSPDTRALFEQQLAKDALSPWRYGFLIQYRQILDLCAEQGVAENLIELSAPTQVQLDIGKGLIYYGGMDVKHSLESAQDIATNFDDTEVLVENLRGQGGGPEGYGTTNQIFTEFFRDGTINRTLLEQANSRGLERIFGP